MGIKLDLELTCGKCNHMMTITLFSFEIIKQAIKDTGWEYIYRLQEGHGDVYCPECRTKV